VLKWIFAQARMGLLERAKRRPTQLHWCYLAQVRYTPLVVVDDFWAFGPLC